MAHRFAPIPRNAITYQWQIERQDMLADMAESDPESNQYLAAEEYLEELERGLQQSGRLAMLDRIRRFCLTKGGELMARRFAPIPHDNAAALEAFAEWAATDEAAANAEELIARAAEGAAEMRKMHDVCRATLTTPMGPTLAPVDPTE